MVRYFVLLWVLLATPAVAAMDFSAIKRSGLLASMAYADKPQIINQLKGLNKTLIRHTVLAETEVSYLLTSSANNQLVAIRGTANLENVLVDLDVQLKQDEVLDIQLHQGFAAAAWAVYTDIKPFLDKSQPIQTTGHSLGGAVAVILAMYLDRDGYYVQDIITFGQPKVTNVAGAQRYSHLPLTRLVTPSDIVPLVPPLSPLDIKDLDIYWHLGQEVILMQDHQYAVTDGIKSMLRATKFISKLPDETNLHAHQMATYLGLINSNAQGAQEVPYKTGISLFGLSLD